MTEERRRIICLLGATGTGKTEASLALAERFHGGVVNFDSRQVYRDLPIVTAQPSSEEQTRCPHRLYGFLASDEAVTAGGFAELADTAIAGTATEGRLPLLVGGTGLYLRAILEGMAPIPEVDEAVRRAVQAEADALGTPELHRRLAEDDPAYAVKVHPNDRQRVTRALEVLRTTGRSLTWWHEHQARELRFDALKIGLALEPAELAGRLALRIEAMLRAGAVEEVERALAVCPDSLAPAFSGIGCPEIIAYIGGRLSLEDMKALWLRNTRAYAKRQMTWFKADKEICWHRPGEHEAMARLAADWLAAC